MPSGAAIPDSIARPDWLSADVWPWPITALSVDRSSVAMSDVGRGPTLLFYTGIGLFIWRDVIARLQHGFRCVTLDPPGIGVSAPIPPSEATRARAARAVTAVIEALELSAAVRRRSRRPPAIRSACAAWLP